MIYIRTDANKEIATGHVMRCMAIAKQIEKLGEPCTFICADEHAKELIENNGFQFVCLHTNWNQLEEELDVLTAFLKEKKAEVILVDSYLVTENYLRTLNSSTKVVYIDDIHQFIYPVHTVINYGIQYKEFHYPLKSGNYLLGCKYIPLREEFQNRKPARRAEVRDILITTGGTDPYNIAGRLIKALDFGTYQIHVVSGRLNIHEKELLTLAQTRENVFVYTDVERMSERMLSCDVAISAAGTTLYELCACGVPTISFSFADNQVSGAKELMKQGIIDYAGDLRTGIKACIQMIETKLMELKNSCLLREERTNKMQKLVDGNGANRIASYCIQLKGEELR